MPLRGTNAARPGVATTPLLVLALACSGCGVFGNSSEPPAISAPSPHSGIQIEESPDRPRLSLIERFAAPSATAALGVAHDLGPEASAALGGLLEGRLRAQGFPEVRLEVLSVGFVITTPVADSKSAARFIQVAHAALQAPVAPGDPALRQVEQRVAGLGSHRDDLGALLSGCTGELAVPSNRPVPNFAQPSAVQTLEQWREQTSAPGFISFAVVGPAPVLSEARAAHGSLPSGDTSKRPIDAWPARPAPLVGDPGAQGLLSVAVRVADGAKAVQAAQQLSAPGSRFRRRLASLGIGDPQRVVGTTRPRGGCLAAAIPVETTAVVGPAELSLVLEDELRSALAETQGERWSLDESVLEPADPREVAARAAWRALSGLEAASTAPVPFVAYRPPLYDAAERKLDQSTLAAARKQAGTSAVSMLSRLEQSSTGVRILLANPCAPSDEDRGTAGSAALWATAVAEAANRRRSADLRFEPWVTGHGVGLIATAHRASPEDDLYTRAAAALGEAVSAPLDARWTVDAREQLLGQLGGTPDPGWQTAFVAFSGEHPSWLDPRGSWSSMNRLGSAAADTRRSLMLHGPWRAAVLSGSPEAEGRVGRELQRWLWPFAQNDSRCPVEPAAVAKPGLYRVSTSKKAELKADAWIIAPLPVASSLSAAGEYTSFLLNRPQGWLEAALRPRRIAASAEARLLGGERNAALAIAIHAEPERLEDAVAQVRGLLERLASGAMTRAELRFAERYFQLRDRERAFDPMFRLVALWFGRPLAAKAPTLAEVRTLQRSLTPARHVVVITTRDK
ncbi:MAG: hypothetical protein AB7K71_11515 [Polyangiaceae bacterium]